MKRFYLSDASDTPPTAPANPSYGYPQDGNLSTRKLPTTVGAYWYHMITEEFMAVIEGAGLEPSETNLHQLNDIFSDFRTRATKAESFAGAAEAAADRAEAAAKGAETETAKKIQEIIDVGDSQVTRITTKGDEVTDDIEAGIEQLQTKLQELIANLQAVGGQEASNVRQAAQEILDDITATKDLVLETQAKVTASEASAATSAANASQSAEDAATSATTAGEKAKASADSAKNSLESATLASQKAESASDSATVASEKANAASESAKSASESLEAATSKAKDVADSASVAADKASEATAKADQAGESAELAKAWATKMDAPVEDDLHSAKWYAVNAQAANEAAIEIVPRLDDISSVLQHADEVHVVGQDLQGINADSLDLGKVSEAPDSITTVKDGYIKKVAEHIDDCIHPVAEALPSLSENKESITKIVNHIDDCIHPLVQNMSTVETVAKNLEPVNKVAGIVSIDYESIFLNGL